ncbi:unnamed protein product [Cuscuta campestris]|uniref:Uncharacterized protein n=1 Tax=Cuscuta campestris TaxID=132261 RepID=A0A484NC29_9ASTE|nr:unnamed protein product [Cuscuta campestris]
MDGLPRPRDNIVADDLEGLAGRAYLSLVEEEIKSHRGRRMGVRRGGRLTSASDRSGAITPWLELAVAPEPSLLAAQRQDAAQLLVVASVRSSPVDRCQLQRGSPVVLRSLHWVVAGRSVCGIKIWSAMGGGSKILTFLVVAMAGELNPVPPQQTYGEARPSRPAVIFRVPMI